MAIEIIDGRPRSIRTEEEVAQEIEDILKSMSPEEQSAFLYYLSKVEEGNEAVLDPLIGVEYIEEPVDPLTFLLDDYYLGDVGQGMWPTLRDDFVELFEGGYSTAILTGAIGVGKTFFATCGLAYILYQISCLAEPQRAYGMAPGTGLAIAVISATRDAARRVPLTELHNKLSMIPYFKEKCPFKTALTMYEIRFPTKKITVVAGSRSGSAIGTNVFGGFLDEMAFFGSKKGHDASGRVVEVDRAEGIVKAIVRRMKSRFQRSGRLPGVMFLASSKEKPIAFIEHMVEEARQIQDPSVFIRDHTTWDVQPKENFSGEFFQIAVGNESVRSKMDPSQEDKEWYEGAGLRIIDVPQEYKPDFESDLEGALRDIAGIATESVSLFIHRREKLVEAVDESLKSPLDVEEWMSGDPLEFWWGRVATPYQRSIPGGFTEDAWRPIRHPGAVRYVHIDVALTGDCAGLVILHIAGHTEVTRRDAGGESYEEVAPVIETDLMLRVLPPPGDEIFIGDIRGVVYEFMAHGFQVSYASMDSWQCLAAGTIVPTGRGMLPIEEVRQGDVVQSRSGPRPVKNSWCFGEQETIRLTTQDGDTLEGTAKHRIEVQQGWGREFFVDGKRNRDPRWEWRRIGDIKEGDVVRLESASDLDCAGYPLHGRKEDFCWRKGGGRRSAIDGWELPERVTPELAEWLGLVWGDGDIGKDGVRLAVTEAESGDAADVFERLFGWRPSFQISQSRHGSGVLRVNSRWLVEWMEHNGLKKPVIPLPVMRSGKQEKAAFLRGLFATDGSVATADGAVSLSMKSRELAEQVRLLLRCDFGIESCLTERERGRPGEFAAEGFHYVVSVRGRRVLFSDLIGFSYSRKQAALDRHRDTVGRRKFAKVKRIERSCAVVHDLEVEGDPSYVANGFVSHNSADTRQQFKHRGIESDVLSVDKTTVPYESLKIALYENRLRLQDNVTVQRELRALQRVQKTKGVIPKFMIDHPAGGSKDLADGLAGGVHSLMTRQPGLPMAPLTSERNSMTEVRDDSWVTGGKVMMPPSASHRGTQQGMVGQRVSAKNMPMPFTRG